MTTPPKKKYSGKYDATIKIAIAREYLTTDMGYRSLAAKYNIPHPSIVDIIKWYKKKYPDGAVPLAPPDKPRPVKAEPNDTELKLIGLQMLIENASKELGIDLVKKFGTKQSDK